MNANLFSVRPVKDFYMPQRLTSEVYYKMTSALDCERRHGLFHRVLKDDEKKWETVETKRIFDICHSFDGTVGTTAPNPELEKLPNVGTISFSVDVTTNDERKSKVIDGIYSECQ